VEAVATVGWLEQADLFLDRERGKRRARARPETKGSAWRKAAGEEQLVPRQDLELDDQRRHGGFDG
jgi:hypothetical protein